jgi:hypothetical protein
MGFGSFLKKAIKGAGKIAKYAAPVLAMTGVGAPLAAGIGAAGALASGGGVKDALLSGGGALAAGKLGGQDGSFWDKIKNVGGGVGNFLTGGQGGSLGGILNAALPALGMYQGYKGMKQSEADTKQARALTDEAAGMARDNAARANKEWDTNSVMRDKFRAIAANYSDPTNPFSSLFANIGQAPGGADPMAPGAGAPSPAAPAAGGGGGSPLQMAALMAQSGSRPRPSGYAGSRDSMRAM